MKTLKETILNSPITMADEKFVKLEVFTPAYDLQFGKFAVKNQANELCLIFDKVLKEDKEYIGFVFDKAQTIEYDIETRNLVLGYDKRFLQTFVNQCLLDIDKHTSCSSFALKYFDSEIEYKVYEAVLADRNIVKIAFKASRYNLRGLKTLSWYFFSKYNYGALHHNDKSDVKNKRLRFKVHRPNKFGKLKEWNVEKIRDSYYDEVDKVYYKEYEHSNVSSDKYQADIEWYNKFRYRPQFYLRFAPENCHFNKKNLLRAIFKTIAKTAEKDELDTIVKDNGVAILKKGKVKCIIEYNKNKFIYMNYFKKCPQGGVIRLKKPEYLSKEKLFEDFDLQFIKIYEMLGLF